jgi:hypothetical protein
MVECGLPSPVPAVTCSLLERVDTSFLILVVCARPSRELKGVRLPLWAQAREATEIHWEAVENPS